VVARIPDPDGVITQHEPSTMLRIFVRSIVITCAQLLARSVPQAS
jgi:hypothetical protein